MGGTIRNDLFNLDQNHARLIGSTVRFTIDLQNMFREHYEGFGTR